MSNLSNDFVPYKESLELKELGFNEKCYGHYDSIGELNTIEDYARLGANISEMLSKEFNSVSYMKEMCAAPLYQQAFRWFREKHGWVGGIKILSYSNPSPFGSEFSKGDKKCFSSRGYNSYEEAELGALRFLIEIINNKY